MRSIARRDPTGWFEELYRQAETNPEVIPWGDKYVNPNLVAWAEKKKDFSGKGRRALVVGCGYGYDAEWLASKGFEVTAFDISQTAITSARRRFQTPNIDFQVANALAPSREWECGFDFVLEAYTLQVLQGEARKRAAHNIAATVKETLLLICRGREEDEESGLMPWPLTKQDLLEIGLARPDLYQVSFEDFMDKNEDPPVRRFRVEYRSINKP